MGAIGRLLPANGALCGLARAALRRAIDEWQRAEARHRFIERAEAFACKLHNESERVLFAFSDVEVSIVQHRLDEFKCAAAGASLPNFGLPKGFIARRVMREEARKQVVAAKAEHDCLVANLSEAESAVQRTGRKVAAAAVDVLIAEGAKQAAALTEAWVEVWRQYDRLCALADCRLDFAEASLPVTLPQDIAVLVRSTAELDDREFFDGRNGAADRAGEVWCCFFEALLTDAEAEVPFDCNHPINNAISPADDRLVAQAAEEIFEYPSDCNLYAVNAEGSFDDTNPFDIYVSPANDRLVTTAPEEILEPASATTLCAVNAEDLSDDDNYFDSYIIPANGRSNTEPPPLKWFDLKCVIWHPGGSKAEEEL